jgi:hypothetical protein
VTDLHDGWEARYALVTTPAFASQPNNVPRITLEGLTRHIRTIGKFFRRLQQLSGARFVTMPLADKLVLYYWDKVVQSTQGADLISGP